jgi:hypothetical protein
MSMTWWVVRMTGSVGFAASTESAQAIVASDTRQLNESARYCSPSASKMWNWFSPVGSLPW